MPKYYLQSADGNGNPTRTYYRIQPAHDHGEGIQFSKDVKANYAQEFDIKQTDVRLGHFYSGQSAGNIPDDATKI